VSLQGRQRARAGHWEVRDLSCTGWNFDSQKIHELKWFTQFTILENTESISQFSEVGCGWKPAPQLHPVVEPRKAPKGPQVHEEMKATEPPSDLVA